MIFIKHIIRMAGLTMLITVFSACSKDFLEVEPKGAVIASKTSDYELLLNDQVLGVIARASHIVMSDELAGYQPLYNPEGGIGSVNDRKAFEYQDDIYLPDENFSELSQLQRQLYSYNKIINEVMDSKEGSDTQKKTIHAEALACRAWVYFMLVNYYGKPYTAATAASDPGIFLIKTADVTQTVFKRSTVKEAYDQIIADLTEAIPLLSPRIVSRYRMSQSAAESILGKVYMNMQQFDKALPLFSSAIAKFSNAIIPVRLYDFNTVFIPGGAFFPVNPITGPNRLNQNVDEEVVYLKKFLNFYSYFYSGIPVSPWTAGLFDQADLRLNFFTRLPFRSTGVVYPLNMMRAYGRYNNMGINVPDIILLKAECESRTGDLLNAVKDLEAFRKRMKITVADAEKIPADIASDKVSLTKYILDERIREYAVTGERWWDMRRLSVDETYKSTVGMMHYVYDANGKIVESMAFPLKPERLTFRLPLYTINTNPGTEQNP